MPDRNPLPLSERYAAARRCLLGASRIVLQDAVDARTGSEVYRLTLLAERIVRRWDGAGWRMLFAASREKDTARGVLCGAHHDKE